MRKFICTVPINDPANIHPCVYGNPAGFRLLSSSLVTRFPIIPVISNTAEKGDEITVVLIKINHPNTEENCRLFREELSALEKQTGFTAVIDEISTPRSELVEDHLELFGSITDRISDGDKLYLDITYGSKPMPVICLMAATCGYKYRKEVSVECILYGSYNFNEKKSSLYDVTSLFYMNNALNMLDGISDPLSVIKDILALDGGDE